MRRIALAAVLAALAGAPPARAANADVRALDGEAGVNARWEPSIVRVQVGDIVTWRFDGSQLIHNVQSTSANWNVDTPGTVGGAPSTYTFIAEGIYTYVCKFHADSMIGEVVVGSPPPPPPPPLSEQPFPNDRPAPTVLEVTDEERPKLTRLRAASVRNGARVRFRLSERARVTVRVKRGGRTVRTARRTFARGAHRLTVRDRDMRGRYRLEVRATDLAGNRSAVRRARVTVG
jgi:plastocyanin